MGYLPRVPGTAGSAVGLLIGWLSGRWLPPLWNAAGLLMGTVVGVAASERVQRESGRHDPSIVVIDEVIGMWAVCAFVPPAIHQQGLGLLVAFVLFRAFDTIKPPPLRRLERLPGGWGIMVDDLGAAAYTCAVLWVIGGLLGR